jgi:hypothetical protein
VDEAVRLLEEALLDENTSARWQARILRIARGPLDLAGFYRTALFTAATQSRVRGALLGLGESGTRGDVALVKPYLEANRPSVRRAALRALADLEPVSTIGPFRAALSDTLPGISKEGRRALEPRLAHVPFAVPAALISSEDAPSHSRRNALSLASHLSKWDGLPLLLEGCGSADGEVAGRARMLLGGWLSRYNRTFPTPTLAHVEKLEGIWARVGGLAQPREELDQIIRLARRLATT